MKPIGPRIAGFFRQPLDDVQDAMTALLTPPRGAAKLALLAVLTCATWFVYVPIHELLHVLGCVATGGTVTELQMQPVYGARWLAEIFPFIVPGGDLAGRLSGFEDYGSDFTYLSSAFAPYLPSLLLGVPLLRSLPARPSLLLSGPAFVLGLAPLINIPGDYFEISTILTTRVVGAERFAALRSDDAFGLMETLATDPAALEVADALPVAWSVVGVSSLLAIALAFASYSAGAWLLGAWRRIRARP